MSFDLREMLSFGGKNGRKPDFRDTLRAIPIFSDLSRRELAAVERILHMREYAAGEIIFRQDEPGLGMYIIESGTVGIYAEGAPENMTELNDGEFFGELPLLDGGERSATAIAKSHCRVFGFFRPDLLSLIERDPQLGVKIVLSLSSIISQRLRGANERVHQLQIELGRIAKPAKTRKG
jgi:CRP/FNR family transcriptional regulator, cyclic AMP receptor protein